MMWDTHGNPKKRPLTKTSIITLKAANRLGRNHGRGTTGSGCCGSFTSAMVFFKGMARAEEIIDQALALQEQGLSSVLGSRVKTGWIRAYP